MNWRSILWQVVFLNRESGGEYVKGLFNTEEEACRKRDEWTKKRAREDWYDMYPMDNDWEYYVRSVTRREVMEARRKHFEEERAQIREVYGRHCDETFVEGCRKMLRRLADYVSSMHESRAVEDYKKEYTIYAPWQDFHKNLKIFAFIRIGPGNSLLLRGQFGINAPESYCTNIKHFDNRDAFMKWIENFDDAVAEFTSKMCD